ncbi:MAG: HipA N-terminal domain-containing protein, partial [Longimicrobiales bacterium]|nr:HipA N-terminal domain-containing protein [Longimicrobiales bacterium]
MKLLHLLLGDAYAGRITQESGRLELTYDEEWRSHPAAFPLSTSMPLVVRSHPDEKLRPFLMGLLPDDPAVRRRWATRFGASANNPFSLLSHVGEECPGACRFVTTERLDAVLAGESDGVHWLDDDELEARVLHLEQDRAAWISDSDPGYFSLAGAQAKFAVRREGGRWGIPTGGRATSHIVKPAIPGFPGILENELST